MWSLTDWQEVDWHPWRKGQVAKAPYAEVLIWLLYSCAPVRKLGKDIRCPWPRGWGCGGGTCLKEGRAVRRCERCVPAEGMSQTCRTQSEGEDVVKVCLLKCFNCIKDGQHRYWRTNKQVWRSLKESAVYAQVCCRCIQTTKRSFFCPLLRYERQQLSNNYEGNTPQPDI